jgi:hypothetical protein
MDNYVRYCPKCGKLLRISEGWSDGYNRLNGNPLYSARVYCPYGNIFNRHYSETLRRLTREEYNDMAGELIAS